MTSDDGKYLADLDHLENEVMLSLLTGIETRIRAPLHTMLADPRAAIREGFIRAFAEALATSTGLGAPPIGSLRPQIDLGGAAAARSTSSSQPRDA